MNFVENFLSFSTTCARNDHFLNHYNRAYDFQSNITGEFSTYLLTFGALSREILSPCSGVVVPVIHNAFTYERPVDSPAR